jgi:cobalt/nickel transport system ATP-binding protein
MSDIIEVKNVSYAYFGKLAALNDVSLSVREGEMFSIIGQNGSGKTTLLNIINALILPDSGEVIFKGTPLSKKSLNDAGFTRQFRQSVGYIFQNPDVQLFCPTVLDELLFGPLQMNIPQDIAIERSNQVLAALGIENLKDRPVYMLSGGEKKKVAIASVLTLNPDVLLIDEPLAGLDPKTQTFFTELLLELNQAGKTIVFTTHHIDLIDHLQPRVAVLSDNHRIHKIDTAERILTDEEFLISVNLIHEHVHRHGDETHRHFHSHYVFHKH